MPQNDASAQFQRALAFQALHQRAGLFLFPNPWDAGSAKILATLGFEALATTSAGAAFANGKPDGMGSLTKDETLRNIRSISQATILPVAADLENGYGDSPEACAQTILDAANAGAVGGSIEDATGHIGDPIYPLELSVERIKAAVNAARSLPFPFTLTARAENMIHGRIDLSDTIKRLVAYSEAGADVLFAPGLRNLADVHAVVQALGQKPVNVGAGFDVGSDTVARLTAAGVRRMSLGSALVRVAYDSLLRAGKELIDTNALPDMDSVISYGDMNVLMKMQKV